MNLYTFFMWLLILFLHGFPEACLHVHDIIIFMYVLLEKCEFVHLFHVAAHTVPPWIS